MTTTSPRPQAPLLSFASLGVLLVLALSLFTARAAHAAPCEPAFPLEAGKPLSWQGADAAYSIPLPDGRDVWIFGDTLYGPDRFVVGNEPRMVHNSLGISTCAHGQWHLNYFIQHDATGDALSYFSPDNPKHWYWALDGFFANGDLWVTLLCIRHPSKAAPAGFDFETCGSDIAQISDLKNDPLAWKVTIHPLVGDGIKAYPSATTVVHDGYAYLFAQYESGTRPLLATRVPLDKLTEPAANLEYLARDGSWKHGFDPANAQEVMKQGSSELSIRYHPELKKWLAVMVDPAWLSGNILLRSSPFLTGPWSKGDVIYRMPEMQPDPGHDKNLFCYAGKEHPELEGNSNLLFTYVCNTMSIPELTSRRDIYHPKVVRQPMPNPLP